MRQPLRAATIPVATVATICALGAASAAAQPREGADAAQAWPEPLLTHLCRTYAGPDDGSADAASCLDRVAQHIGARLADAGPSGVPAQDVAALALLLSRAQGTDHAAPQAAPETRDEAPDDASDAAQGPPGQLSDLGKGQEGFRQGVDRLASLPVSERLVVTGDVTAGFQAATVSDAPELTAAFGRARVNFVTRAVPASDDGLWDEGYFFVQMIAAGGPFDASAVGGPATLSPLNDVSTDRSAFNQGASRGNLYLKKAFFQQGFRLGDQGTISGRIGVISLSDLFDTSEFANNESRQFINAALVNSPAFKAGLAAPGFMAEYRRPIERGWLDAVTIRTGYAVTRTFRALTSPVWTNEVELRTRLWGRPGTYRGGASVGNVPDTGGVHGIHVGGDQWLTDDVGVFGRYARSNRGPGSVALGPVRASYSVGGQWRLGDGGGDVSALGVGFSQAFPITPPGGALASERIVETYYRRHYTENFSLTPGLQIVFGAGGRSDGGTHVVGTFRVNVGF